MIIDLPECGYWIIPDDVAKRIAKQPATSHTFLGIPVVYVETVVDKKAAHRKAKKRKQNK